MTGVPLVAAFYFMDVALQRSLDLGFNPQVVRTLQTSADEPQVPQDRRPRQRSALPKTVRGGLAASPGLLAAGAVEGTVRNSLRVYFGIGLVGAVLMAVGVAVFLSRRINRSYEAAFEELMAQRDRVSYLEQMASWQELARILAHEIKNPLTPIEVLVTSLSRAYQSKSAEAFREQLTQAQLMIGEELDHLKRTVSRFSELRQAARAAIVDEASPLQLIQSLLPALSASFESAHIHVDPGAGLEPDALARMDASLFRQVLTNIVANGVEANRGKRVSFLIGVASIDHLISLSISNDGKPVVPALAARLFDPTCRAVLVRTTWALGSQS